VFVNAPANPAAAHETAFFFERRILSNPAKTYHATIPTRIRGIKATINAIRLPFDVPGKSMKGEKTNEVAPGKNVANSILANPNVNPNAAPYLGPSNNAPTMTGMCNVVGRKKGNGMIPIPVKVNKKMIAANIAVTVTHFV